MQRIKRLIKNILLLCGVLLHNNRKRNIFYYHDIHDGTLYTDMSTDFESFQSHIKTLRKLGYIVVTNINNANNQVAIMFDDGFHGIYDCREYFYTNNICPTVFLAVSLIGQPGYLTVEEIVELQNHGFNFQSHGWRHEDMTLLSDEQLHLELVEARKKLSELLGKSVDEICLPIGYFSDRLLKNLSKEGYHEIYSSIPGDYDTLVSGMRRRNLAQTSSSFQVSLILKGGMTLLSKHYLKLHKR